MNGSELKGDGGTHIAVGDRQGKIILQFPHPVEWIALDPQTGVAVAKSMIDAAVNCGLRVEIKAPKPEVTEGQRVRMETRCLMILKNKREHTEKDPVLARRLVDTILNILDL